MELLQWMAQTVEAVGSVEQMFGRFCAELIHQFPAGEKNYESTGSIV